MPNKTRDEHRKRTRGAEGKLTCSHCGGTITGHDRCRRCGILLHDENEAYRDRYGLQPTFRVGEICVRCFCSDEEITYPDPIYTFEEIGKEYGYSRERVRQIYNRALAKIRESKGFMESADSIQDTTRVCKVCGKPVHQKKGQLVHYHARCRPFRNKGKYVAKVLQDLDAH